MFYFCSVLLAGRRDCAVVKESHPSFPVQLRWVGKDPEDQTPIPTPSNCQDTLLSPGFQMDAARGAASCCPRFPHQQGQGRRKPLTAKKNLSPPVQEQPCSHPPLKTLSPTCCICSTSCRTLDELCSSCQPFPLTLLKDKRSRLKKETTKIMFW